MKFILALILVAAVAGGSAKPECPTKEYKVPWVEDAGNCHNEGNCKEYLWDPALKNGAGDYSSVATPQSFKYCYSANPVSKEHCVAAGQSHRKLKKGSKVCVFDETTLRDGKGKCKVRRRWSI